MNPNPLGIWQPYETKAAPVAETRVAGTGTVSTPRSLAGGPRVCR
jgi:hypothetical protein